jgi:hypothetical protein
MVIVRRLIYNSRQPQTLQLLANTSAEVARIVLIRSRKTDVCELRVQFRKLATNLKEIISKHPVNKK